jgi:hypothetical protein
MTKRQIMEFLFWLRLVLSVFWELSREFLCKKFSKGGDHPWEPTSTMERSNTKVYARCPRCGAVR